MKTLRFQADSVRGRRAFTLIELLTALAVFSILVLFVGRLFNEASRASRSGMRQVDQLASARICLDLVARDLATAVANSTTTFYFTDDPLNSLFGADIEDLMDSQTYSDVASTLLFVASVQQRPGPVDWGGGTHRALAETRYTPRRYRNAGELRRAMRPAGRTMVSAHYDPYWMTGVPSHSTFDYPAAFRVEAYVLDGGIPRRFDHAEYFSSDEGDRLPLFVDVLYEALSAEQREILRDMAPQDACDAYIRRHAQRHATRVAFEHRTGMALELR